MESYLEYTTFINGIDNVDEKLRYKLIAKNIGSINNIYEALCDIKTCGVDGVADNICSEMVKEIEVHRDPVEISDKELNLFEPKMRDFIGRMESGKSKQLDKYLKILKNIIVIRGINTRLCSISL